MWQGVWEHAGYVFVLGEARVGVEGVGGGCPELGVRNIKSPASATATDQHTFANSEETWGGRGGSLRGCTA
eukprot:COSAG02_NODE_60243_length_272_cov_0.549133_1_plen_70_part_10